MTSSDSLESASRARRQGRLDDAERDLLRAIGEARRDGPRTALIRGLKALAHVVRDRGHDERAMPLYEEAVALSREEGNSLLLAHAIRHLGGRGTATPR